MSLFVLFELTFAYFILRGIEIFVSHTCAISLSHRVVRHVPILNERSALRAVRRLRYIIPNCRVWALVASAYLNRAGCRCNVRFSSRFVRGRLAAHAFLKFADGTTIGERGDFVELH